MSLARRRKAFLTAGMGLLVLGIVLGIVLRLVYVFQWSDTISGDAAWTEILHRFFFEWDAWWAVQSSTKVVALWLSVFASFASGMACLYAASHVQPDYTLRKEQPEDRAQVFALHTAAFDTDAEARLVDALREQAKPIVSIVAEVGGEVVGHILFSPATHEEHTELQLMGLAPMAVLPKYQRLGIGSALVQEGLAACRAMDVAAVIVLGHPAYYPRFGFCPAASTYGITSEYEVPDDVFLALQLQRRALKDCAGRVHYHPAFASLG